MLGIITKRAKKCTERFFALDQSIFAVRTAEKYVKLTYFSFL